MLPNDPKTNAGTLIITLKQTSILRLGAGTSEIKFNRCSRVCEPAPNLYRALE